MEICIQFGEGLMEMHRFAAEAVKFVGRVDGEILLFRN